MNFPKRARIISLMKKTAINLTDGPILRSIITFAIPIVISNIFQQLYNTADIMIVGRFLGQDALAAVGATAAIFELIVGFALGVGNGMGVIIARYYGANNHRLLKRAVSATIVIGAVLSLLVALGGTFGMYPLLEFLGTPASIIDQSYAYISIIVLGIAVTFAYNLCAGLLRAVGDSQAALYFLIFQRWRISSSIFYSLQRSIWALKQRPLRRLLLRAYRPFSALSISKNAPASLFRPKVILSATMNCI